MAAVDITCPHCSSNQKVAEHRLKESVYCLKCQQLITDVYLYKVAPKQQELTIKLKGRIVSEFGTTKLSELKSKSDEYTGRFEPVDEDDSDEVEQVDETTRIFETSTYQELPRRQRMSTAAKTYLIGGIVVAALTICVTVLGITLLAKEEQVADNIESVSADGARLERYPNGATKAEWRVVNVGGVDLIDGAWQEWHDDGSKKALGKYVRGDRVGDWRAWHPDGQPALDAKYEAGKPVGPWLEWHANGRKAVEGAYKDGEKNGEWRTWFSNGGYATLEKYELGQPVGDWVTWYPDGKVRMQGAYVAGLRDGRWATFHDNDAEESVEFWKEGVLNGESWGGHRNRQKSFQGTWAKGRREGTWSWWYTNGRLERQGAYEEGLEDGLWQEWYATSEPRRKGSYEKGRRTGTWQEFEEDGSLACRTEYLEGAQISERWYFRGDEVIPRRETFPDGSPKLQWTTRIADDGSEVRHGRQKTYYSNGGVAESGTWANGKRDGIWQTYDEAGNLLSEETWKHGEKQ